MEERLLELERKIARLTDDLDATRAQVGALQARERRLTRAMRALCGAGLAAAAGALLLVTAQPALTQRVAPLAPTRVRAPFEVLGTSGRPIFTISDTTTGGVARAFSRTGIPIVEMGVGTTGWGILKVNNSAGKQLAAMGGADNARGAVGAFSATGKGEARLTVAVENGGGDLEFKNKSGIVVCNVGTARHGGHVVTFSQTGRATTALSTSDAGSGMLEIANPSGGRRILAAVNVAQDKGTVCVSGPAGGDCLLPP